MRLLKKIFNQKLIVQMRNLFGFRPLKFFLPENINISISDTFIWRNDNNFKTIIRFSDILKNFYKVSNTKIELLFYDNNNNKIKELIIERPEPTNEIIIDQSYFNGFIGVGIFYIFHDIQKEFEFKEKVAISNRCYVGYSKKSQNPSFVHGNYLAKFKDLDSDFYRSNIIQKSFIKKKKYQIQCDFSDFNNVELIFTNPINSKINFLVNKTRYNLEGGCLKVISLTNYKKPIITIFSNLLFFRPIIFSYKDEFYDVYHS